MEETCLMFVYGTLKIGGEFSRTPALEKNRISSRPAVLFGDLYCTKYYPCLHLADGKHKRLVFGELHEFKHSSFILEVMDGIEGEGSLYIRKKARVRTSTGIETAWVYEFNFEKFNFMIEEKVITNGVWNI